MQKLITERLEEILVLMNNSEAVVSDKELKTKLEKVLSLVSDPSTATNEEKEYQEKMTAIVKLIDNAIIDPDIDVDYCIPSVLGTTDSCDLSRQAYVLLTYNIDEYTTRTKKVSLSLTALQSTPEDLTKHVILAIEAFKDEMDDIQFG